MISDLGLSIRSVLPGPNLRRELESVRVQGFPVAEVCIVVPDDLDPAGLSAWSDFIEESPVPIRLVTAKRGMITQRVAGVQASRTRLTLLLDDDLVLPSGFIQTMVAALDGNGAHCVIPWVQEARPRRGLLRIFFCVFLLAVPYRGKGGNRYLPSGGYLYSLEPPSHGEAFESEGGIGWAFLVDTEFARTHPQRVDMQQADTLYSTREDAAFSQALKLAGGRIFMVNAGPLLHLGGTTLLDRRRLFWQWESEIRDNVMFWRSYIYGPMTSRFARVAARAALAWRLVGSMMLALATVVRTKSIAPLRGVASGFCKLIRGG